MVEGGIFYIRAWGYIIVIFLLYFPIKKVLIIHVNWKIFNFYFWLLNKVWCLFLLLVKNLWRIEVISFSTTFQYHPFECNPFNLEHPIIPPYFRMFHFSLNLILSHFYLVFSDYNANQKIFKNIYIFTYWIHNFSPFCFF